MRIAVVGHVDHGKSTLIGRLLYDTESLPDSKISEVQSLVNEYKRRFEFAYFLDSFKEELEEERTIDTTRVCFRHAEIDYEVVDVPGHREYIRNMLTGASSADIAVLVVDATTGVMEQTRRHSYLLKLLGIGGIIIAVNKMDLVGHNETRYKYVLEKVQEVLGSYKLKLLGVVAISALNGENVVKPSDKLYYTNVLVDVLSKCKPNKVKDKGLRLVIQGIYKDLALMKVVSGELKKGDEIVNRHWVTRQTIAEINKSGVLVDKAVAGDCIELELLNIEARRGQVFYGVDVAKDMPMHTIISETVILAGELKEGDDIHLVSGPVDCNAQVALIQKIINTETGSARSRNRGVIKEGLGGLVKYNIGSGASFEKFKDCETLGRFVVYKDKEPIGLGIVV